MRRLLLFAVVLVGGPMASADDKLEPPLERRRADQDALVHAPEGAKANLAPVVFAFHGHGGSMRDAAKKFAIHTVCARPLSFI